MRYGDLVTLMTGETVRVNSVDTSRKMFDYLTSDGNECVTLEAGFSDVINWRMPEQGNG